MITRQQAVEIALAWKGTPYVKGARIRGVGCDCETLLEAYLIAIGAAGSFDHLPLFQQDWFCHTTEEKYRDELAQYATCTWEGRCIGTPPALPGDIAIYRVVGSKVYNHGGIIIGWPKAIHAYGDRGVCETRPALHPLTAYREMAVFSPIDKQNKKALWL